MLLHYAKSNYSEKSEVLRMLTLFVGNGSVVEVYTINASRVSTVTLADRCHWLCYSSASEGVSVNVIAGALSNATIQ